MAVLSITIPDNQVDRVRAAFAERAGKLFDDMTAEDARQVILVLVKSIVEDYETRQARLAISTPELDAT